MLQQHDPLKSRWAAMIIDKGPIRMQWSKFISDARVNAAGYKIPARHDEHVNSHNVKKE